MLILSRKVGEEIVIGENIRVAVTQLDHNRAFLGIAAPSDVRIDREEIWKRKRMASNHPAGSLIAPLRPR